MVDKFDEIYVVMTGGRVCFTTAGAVAVRTTSTLPVYVSRPYCSRRTMTTTVVEKTLQQR